MSVTEQFEGWGKFDLTLRGLPDDTTPAEVWRAVDPTVSAFGHILITPTEVDAAAVGDAGLLSMAKYAGIYRGTRARNQLQGVGLVAWLGDEDDKGDIAETAKTGGAKTFAGWVADVLPAAITAGTITAIAGTLNESMLYMTPRAMLARVMDYFGGVYRVNPDGTLDAGPEASLFAVEPNHLLHWRGSGPDGGLHGLRPATIELARDLDDYTTKVLMLAEGEGATVAVGSAVAGSVPYKDLHGNAVVRKRVVDAPDVSAGNANTLAAAQLGRFNRVRTGYQLSTTEWGVAVLNRNGKRLEPGDYVWAYDPRPDARLVDPANQLVFQGETITPALHRLEAITWPILEGMGVYLRYYDGATVAIVDLSPHVEWETGETTLEVGAAPRRLTDTAAGSAVQARIDSVASGQVIADADQDVAGGALTTSFVDKASVVFTKPADWNTYKLVAWGSLNGNTVSGSLLARIEIGASNGAQQAGADTQVVTLAPNHSVTAQTASPVTVAIAAAETVNAGYFNSIVQFIAYRLT